MSLAIQTRFKRSDYEYWGDVGAFKIFEKNFEDCDFHNNLIVTSKPAVLLWYNQLYVTGIQTSRKDEVGRTIRYSFFLESPEASTLFDGIKAELQKEQKNNGTTGLGDNLDKLFKITQESTLPELPQELEEKFFTNILDPLRDKSNENKKKRIWTTFLPVKDNIENFVNGLNIPEGFEIEVEGFEPFSKEKPKKKTLLGRRQRPELDKSIERGKKTQQ